MRGSWPLTSYERWSWSKLALKPRSLKASLKSARSMPHPSKTLLALAPSMPHSLEAPLEWASSIERAYLAHIGVTLSVAVYDSFALAVVRLRVVNPLLEFWANESLRQEGLL